MGYSTRKDSENVFGPTNIRRWADIENKDDKSFITARIAWAIAEAQTEIDGKLRGGPYEVPFTTVPDEIVSISSRLVGCLLYEARGATDSDGESSKFVDSQRKRAMMMMRRVLAGQLRLEGANPVTASYPRIVEEVEPSEGPAFGTKWYLP